MNIRSIRFADTHLNNLRRIDGDDLAVYIVDKQPVDGRLVARDGGDGLGGEGVPHLDDHVIAGRIDEPEHAAVINAAHRRFVAIQLFGVQQVLNICSGQALAVTVIVVVGELPSWRWR